MGKKIENATIIFKNGEKKLYEIVTIMENGVYTGYKNSFNKSKKKIIEHGFIPKDQILKIIISKNHGKKREIIFS